MIPPSQIAVFSDELQKLGAHPYLHATGATLGTAAALYGMTPYMFREHERDVRDADLGIMTAEAMKRRHNRRYRQLAAGAAVGATLGGLSPFAFEVAQRVALEKYRALRGEAVSAARDVSREAAQGVADVAMEAGKKVMSRATEGAREVAHSAVQGAASALNEHKDDIIDAARSAGSAAASGAADAAEERLKANAAGLREFLSGTAEESARRGRSGLLKKAPKAPKAPADDLHVAGTGLLDRMFR
jgi:hypothetical protein